MNTPQKLVGLARILVQQQLLTEAQAISAAAQATANGIAFVSQLLQSKVLKAPRIAEAAASTFGLPIFDLNALPSDFIPATDIDAALMQSHRMMPILKRGNTLFLAVSDPTQATQAIEEIKFQLGVAISVILVEEDKLGKWIDRLTKANESTMQLLLTDTDGSDVTVKNQGGDQQAIDVDDAPVVKYLQKILSDAINLGASDIHFEPYEKFYRIRYRVDGVLREIGQPPLAIKEKLASRIKVISNLDISEKRIPQDGRMKLNLSTTRHIDFRVSTLPMLNGEKIVMRILDPNSATLGIEALGYESEQKEALLRAVSRPYGLVLVTGPTGSGKTVSLYTCLNILNKPDINISTAEDPAEIPLPGINQVNVNDKQGLTFAAALKSFLRQDPDVIMIGEIRDLETADMAIKASSTGHMVLSTLHTNDAPSTLTRLMNMGVAPFNIASAVSLITAQRLARRLCPHCRQPAQVPKEALISLGFEASELDGSWQLYTAHEEGCDQCTAGYKGRVGIYQVMPVTDAISRIIMKNGTSHDIADQAKIEGVKDLRQSGLLKVKQGLTTLAEIEAVTNL